MARKGQRTKKGKNTKRNGPQTELPIASDNSLATAKRKKRKKETRKVQKTKKVAS